LPKEYAYAKLNLPGLKKPMKNPLWRFSDNQGTFSSDRAHRLNTLYLPLCNSYPFMSSVTPDLHGDAKTNNNSFLLEPASRITLSNSKVSRNFWIYLNPDKVWSATGVSKDLSAVKNDRVTLRAGLLWQEITRRNRKIGLESRITSFVPASGEPVEIMLVTITNISGLDLKITPFAAIPIYGRSANNLRDHRHVTALLNRLEAGQYGVSLTPTLLFDETGHHGNRTAYFVWGIEQDQQGPQYIYPTQEEFCGEGSDLEAPQAVYQNLLPKAAHQPQGKEAIGALRFRERRLKSKGSISFAIIMGIAPKKEDTAALFAKFNRLPKITAALEATKNYWQEKACQISVATNNSDFDNWFRWVSIQPVLRKIFGCSFLPDFDYGRGGRGWRDLWQDCLSLILTNPQEAKPLLMNNFSGVRADGSNATIIGQQSGEFIADRNNISRVWMDHGVWPLVSTLLYVHQTGDLKILLQKAGYFRDQQLSRARLKDEKWKPRQGKILKTAKGRPYLGTILEHLLVENLVQFFNVGRRNNIRLEGADWNDGLDMAAESGESVAFSCMYAKNLADLSQLLAKLGQEKIVVFKELAVLLDTSGKKPLDYSSYRAKQKLLAKYFNTINHGLSGEVSAMPVEKMIGDLREKSDWLTQHIRRHEWLRHGFFNGYYDNDSERLEGDSRGIIRMTLTAQALAILGRIATREQISSIFKRACVYLQDKEFGGFHLNTDFKKELPNLGRAFSFSYGDKENGAFFNHMSVIFGYALYARGFVKEGFQVLDALSKMALDSEKSKIYPCLPEYFNSQGQGMYCYLTGSASWYVLTLLTQVFGVRGEYGNLLLEPKLTAAQFKNTQEVSISANFAQKPIRVIYSNPSQKEFGQYVIKNVLLNDKLIASHINSPRFLIAREKFLALAARKLNLLKVTLGDASS
jgi:cellobiose phosphorylase